MQYSVQQLQVIETGYDKSIFLSGPAGTGKTSAGVERLKHLINSDVPGNEILLLFPQRTLGTVFQNAVMEKTFTAKSLPVIATVGGLARRGIELFWPLIADVAGFHKPGELPHFLTLDLSLYFLSKLIQPLIEDEGFFSTVTIQRNRLYSQILDNLNKSAVHGFPHTEIATRLNSSWIGDPVQSNIFQDAQDSAVLFREHCYQNNLLDYSLQIEVFSKFLVNTIFYKDNFNQQFSHLIFDNIEEDVPIAHDFIDNYLDYFSSSLLIFDNDSGYRSFLGASPDDAYNLMPRCNDHVEFVHSYTTPDYLDTFSNVLSWALDIKDSPPPRNKELENKHEEYISVNYQPYYPQLVSWVATKIADLINNGSTADEIVILAPFMSDSLRFLLSSALNKMGIESWSHRPSRPLRDEPSTNCLLTLSAIAHPSWNILPTNHDLALSFIQSIDGLDLTRSKLLANHCVDPSHGKFKLVSFEEMDPSIQERITYTVGNRYQYLKDWLKTYQETPPQPLDHFLIRLFGELLSQPGFGFHNDLKKGAITDQIVSSVNKFRNSAGSILLLSIDDLGAEYYSMVKAGLLANQYLRTWDSKPSNSVYILPAYTYLLSNTPVDYQFWLDVGSRGWYERIFQPLTNPYILNRSWNLGETWSDFEEVNLNRVNCDKISTGLIRRCKKGIFFCLTDTDERGSEQKGLLIQAINNSFNQIRSSN